MQAGGRVSARLLDRDLFFVQDIRPAADERVEIARRCGLAGRDRVPLDRGRHKLGRGAAIASPVDHATLAE